MGASNAVAVANGVAALEEERPWEAPAVPLAPVRPSELMPPLASFRQMQEMADALFRSGLMAHANNAAGALAVMLKGRELGVPAMAAIEGITIIKGKASVSPHLMLALIKRDVGPGAIRVAETSAKHCVVEYREPGWPGVKSFPYTMADAQTAGLAGGENWKKYPAAMLRARAVSAVGKMAFADVIGGMYVHGERGEEVEVTEDGDVVPAAPAERPADPPPEQDLRTDEQSKRIFATARDLGIANADLKASVKWWTGKDSSKDLTRKEATLVIDRLAELADAEDAEGVDRETGEVVDGEYAELPGMGVASQPAGTRRHWEG